MFGDVGLEIILATMPDFILEPKMILDPTVTHFAGWPYWLSLGKFEK